MTAGYQALTEKEKQTLRLIVRGHDAKSTARHLGLSVHTINERLRDARRKLEVSSSREAARLVLETEGDEPELPPQLLGDTRIGEAVRQGGMADDASSQPGHGAGSRLNWPLTGVIAMSIALATLAVAALTQGTALAPQTAPASPPAVAVPAETEAAAAARAWLVLGDEGRWEDGWRGTGAAFQKLNTPARWAEAATGARVPLGAVVSRTLIGQENVPAPPAGVEVVKFRTDFANRQGVVETVSLAREDGAWKVVGVYMDWPD